jgi:hypothetical protein
MSKALGYSEAVAIIEACVLSGCEPPTLKWLMGKRRPRNWAPILDAAVAMRNEARLFKWLMDEDRETYDPDDCEEAA